MNRVLTLVSVAAFAVLVGCSSGLDRKLDGSSEQAFATTLATMKKTAKAEDVARLDESLRVLAITDVSIGYEGGILGALQKVSLKTPEQLAEPLLAVVHGKTGREVIALGQKRKAEEGAKQLAGIDRELAQLKKMREEKSTGKQALAPIEVLVPTIRFDSIGPEKISVIEFKVRNGSETGISYLYLRGTVRDAASGQALFSDDFKYKLSDEPLLPGDTKSIRLPYSGHGKWNAPEIWGKPVMLAVEVDNADNLTGQKLAASFTLRDQDRLIVLEKNREALQKMLAGS